MTSPYRPVVRFAGLRGERHGETRNLVEVDSVLPADPEAPSHAYERLPRSAAGEALRLLISAEPGVGPIYRRMFAEAAIASTDPSDRPAT
jgi:hypothetical protein